MTTDTQPIPDRSETPDARRRAAGATTVPAAKTPVSSTNVAAFGVVWSLLLVALGVVGIHDALVAAGVIPGTEWIGVVVDAVGRLSPSVVLLVVGTALGLVGLVLLWYGLRPRRRRGVAVGAEAGTFLRHRQLARLVSARVDTLDGVVSARASARKRTVHVRVRGVDGIDTDDLTARVRALVADDLSVLAKRVRTRVQVSGGRR